jgi:hypothetical protein
MGTEDQEFEVASVWQHSLLGSTAVYEVVEDLGDVVLVAVREAPGLIPGTQLRMTRDALATMRRVSDVPSRASQR